MSMNVRHPLPCAMKMPSAMTLSAPTIALANRGTTEMEKLAKVKLFAP